MWFALIINYMLWLSLLSTVRSHLPDYAVTPSNKVDQFCSLAESCIHDTIPICGRMGEETRTFLDICDLLEFACDKNQRSNRACSSTNPLPPVGKSFVFVTYITGNIGLVVPDTRLQSIKVKTCFNALHIFVHIDDMEGCPTFSKT